MNGNLVRSSHLPQAVFCVGEKDVPGILRHVLGLVRSSQLLQACFFDKNDVARI